RYNEADDNFTNFTFSDDSINPSHNIVLSIHQDVNGILWIGTLKGLVSFNKNTNESIRYFVNDSETNSLNSNRINSIIEPSVLTNKDKRELLWLGTGDGLFQFNTSDKTFNKIKPPLSGSSVLTNNNILSLYEDQSGLIWIGTAEDGVVKYDKERLKFKHYRHDQFNPNSLNYNTIRALFHDDETLWIGTLG